MNNLKEINIKNCSCFYFDDLIKIEDLDFDNIQLDEKSYENILIYDFSCKTLIGAKPLRIKFDKVDGFVRVYDDYRYLVLFASEKYDAICILIRYTLSKKGVLHMVF